MEGIPKKQYGLILPKKLQIDTVSEIVKKPSVFRDSDGESDDESPADWMQKTLQKEKYCGARSKHSKAEIEKLIKEDPSIYQYDEVYDEIEKTRNEALAAKKAEKVERKPRYVQILLATAEKRKKENERRIARQVQKEREAEGDEFADKEVFVTSAYKVKLEEMKALEKEEKEQERLEKIGDVTKQSDLSGFYRHLYEKVVLDVEDEVLEKPVISKKKERQAKYSRQYRKRKASESSDEGASPLNTILSEEIADQVRESELKLNIVTQKEAVASKKDEVVVLTEAESKDEGSNMKTEPEGSSSNEEKDENENEKSDDDENKENKVKPIKINVWDKRTVGEVFEAALQRYYERRARKLALALV